MVITQNAKYEQQDALEKLALSWGTKTYIKAALEKQTESSH